VLGTEKIYNISANSEHLSILCILEFTILMASASLINCVIQLWMTTWDSNYAYSFSQIAYYATFKFMLSNMWGSIGKMQYFSEKYIWQ
jgi:hypothetical protein